MDLFDDTPPAPFVLPQDEGFDLSWDDALCGFRVVVPKGELIYWEHFFNKKISDKCTEYFQENNSCDWRSSQWQDKLRDDDVSAIPFKNIAWKQDMIKFYGKCIALPRLTAWYGDENREYTYSGITSKPNKWNQGLLYLKREIESAVGVEFNSVLLNWYRDGEDYLNWHSDDEKELGPNPTIASANFGEERDFVVRSKLDKSQKIIFPLKHGTLLLMRGELQHYWEHSVPKRKKVNRSRFNLTFRHLEMENNLT